MLPAIVQVNKSHSLPLLICLDLFSSDYIKSRYALPIDP